ncbi:hypothetical protein AWRI1631_10730 [Saccharomyces cerevisiae AWRI1631]|uniref:Uncharacterized protein n=1 Tax=Saccharomyces cerevisiae (strain AWRI1631) TaxID=545124 RepID=B5VDN2_YEAS6|nr:hypothetical protein AWRI1631_10730 [Saccharomyces cerevisiae AWRI1631]
MTRTCYMMQLSFSTSTRTSNCRTTQPSKTHQRRRHRAPMAHTRCRFVVPHDSPPLFSSSSARFATAHSAQTLCAAKRRCRWTSMSGYSAPVESLRVPASPLATCKQTPRRITWWRCIVASSTGSTCWTHATSPSSPPQNNWSGTSTRSSWTRNPPEADPRPLACSPQSRAGCGPTSGTICSMRTTAPTGAISS